MVQRISVSDLLPYGERNAVSRLALADATGLPERIVRLRINKLRLSGAPILSGNAGYWLSANPHEIAAFARSMRHRASEVARVAEAMQRTADELIGQGRLEGF